MMKNNPQTLQNALNGDIHAFQVLFGEFHEALKSYLYRMTASRADAEDMAHDTFIRAFDKLHTFRQDASLKTWVFQIATNLTYNFLKKRNRWTEEVSEEAKYLVMINPALAQKLSHTNQHSPYGRYEIKEHIDTCFTCLSKTLPIQQQVALLLKDMYDFSVKEIMTIMEVTEGQAKYYLQAARQSLTDIFDQRCALVNKQGICHQCSELNGWLNPKQDQQAAKMALQLVKDAENKDKKALFEMRVTLVKGIDPLRSPGHELQEALMKCNRIAMGESVVE
ncbi:MAG: RNA polymerase sigma factor [Bacteroidota bacterium]